jgi:hypothetical protein
MHPQSIMYAVTMDKYASMKDLKRKIKNKKKLRELNQGRN